MPHRSPPTPFGSALAIAAAGALAVLHPEVSAQPYPTRPVRVVNPSAPGGNADILSRILGEVMAKGLGQPVVIENRVGGSTTIATAAVAKAPADGYTVLFISSSFAITASTFRDLPYDPARDFAGIGLVGGTPMLLVANPRVPATSVQELIALARTKPGALNYAQSGNISPAHLAGELLNVSARIKLVAVPYKATAQGTADTIAGTVDLAFPSLSSALQFVKSGKLRAIGITAAKRSPLAPDIPAIAESQPGYQASIWNGMLAPAGTPAPVVARLNAELNKALNAPEVRTRLAGLGVDVETSTPEEFGSFVEGEIRKWGRLIAEAGIKVELDR